MIHGDVIWPTQDLVDQYLVTDEKTGEAKVWYESSQIKDNIDFLNTTGLKKGSIETLLRFDGEKRYIPTSLDLTTSRGDYPLITHNLYIKNSSPRDITDLMYMNRDKRMDATIVRDKTSLLGEYLEMNMGGNASQGIRLMKTEHGIPQLQVITGGNISYLMILF